MEPNLDQDHTAAALGRASASLARGESIPHDEVLRELGPKQ
jgi:hypothetical protein